MGLLGTSFTATRASSLVEHLFDKSFTISRCDETPLIVKMQSIELELAAMRAKEAIPASVMSAVVAVGVAVPAVKTGQAQATWGGITYSVQLAGSGWFFDPRGLVLSCEHVRQQGRNLLQLNASSKLVVCPYVGSELNWEAHAWEAQVLSHTEHWDTTITAQSEPATSATVVVSPDNADAAVLRVTRHMLAGLPVANPVMVGASPIATLRLGDPSTLRDAEEVFILGFPKDRDKDESMPIATPTSTRGSYGNEMSDSYGRWIKVSGLMMPGHSGGPLVGIRCPPHGGPPMHVVYGWSVRAPKRTWSAAGLCNCRPIGLARGCIDAALQHPALPMGGFDSFDALMR